MGRVGFGCVLGGWGVGRFGRRSLEATAAEEEEEGKEVKASGGNPLLYWHRSQRALEERRLDAHVFDRGRTVASFIYYATCRDSYSKQYRNQRWCSHGTTRYMLPVSSARCASLLLNRRHSPL